MTPVRPRAADKLPDYVLRDIPVDAWKRFKARAAAEGHTIRWVLLQFVQFYVDRGLPKGK